MAAESLASITVRALSPPRTATPLTPAGASVKRGSARVFAREPAGPKAEARIMEGSGERRMGRRERPPGHRPSVLAHLVLLHRVTLHGVGLHGIALHGVGLHAVLLHGIGLHGIVRHGFLG